MARVWKRKADKRKTGSPWMLTYTDWRIVGGRWVSWERTKTAYTDKRESMALGTQLEDKARMKRDGRIDEREDRRALEARRGLTDHIDEYEQALQAKGSNPKHVGQTIGYIREIVDTLKWATVGSIRADTLMRHLGDKRAEHDWSPRTLNARVIAIKGLTRWLVEHDRLPADPLASTKQIHQTTDIRRNRRAFSRQEVEQLVESTMSGPSVRFGRLRMRFVLTGSDRAMLYRVMLGTGLRVAEVSSLTRRSFDLDTPDGPVVTLEAAYSKRKRRDVQPIPESLAVLLRLWIAEKVHDEPLWVLPYKPTERLLRPDLRRARARWLLGISKGKPRGDARESDFRKYRNSAGRFADFHAMRHTYVTRLSMSNVPLPVAQRLARHSSPMLTANTYTHVGLADGRAALDRAFGKSQKTGDSSDFARATGTDGASFEQEAERSAIRTLRRSSCHRRARQPGSHRSQTSRSQPPVNH